MKNYGERLHSELLNAKTIAASLLLLVVAVSLLWISATWSKDYPIFLGNVVPSLASVIATSGIFAIAYEIFIRRQQTSFVLEAIDLKESLLRTGLDYISLNYLDFDYGSEIRKAKSIRLFLLYGQTWFNRYSAEIQEFLRKPDVKFVLCVPDPKSQFLSPLAAHFGWSHEELTKRIADSVVLCALPAINGQLGKGSSVEIYMHKARPSVSIYQFDNSLLMGTYYGSTARRRAPMFRFVDAPNSLYADFASDIDAIITNHSEIVYNSSNQTSDLKSRLKNHVSKETLAKL